MPNNYAKLRNTYTSYNDSNLGDTPDGWWAIIGSNKKQATVINPFSPHSTSGTCQDFSDQWTADIGVEQGPIPYYYDATSDPGTITCKTTQDGSDRTVILTCSGDKCCGGDALNGLIPKGVSFPGQVRQGDTSKPQCIVNVPPSTIMGFKCDISKRTCKNPKGCPDTANCIIGEEGCNTTDQLTCKDQDHCPSCMNGHDNQGSYDGIEEDCQCDDHGNNCTLKKTSANKGTGCCYGCYQGYVDNQPMKFCNPCPPCAGAQSTVACPDWLPAGDPNKNPGSDYWRQNQKLTWGGGLDQYCNLNFDKGSKAQRGSGWHDCGKHGGWDFTAMVDACCPPGVPP